MQQFNTFLGSLNSEVHDAHIISSRQRFKLEPPHLRSRAKYEKNVAFRRGQEFLNSKWWVRARVNQRHFGGKTW